MAEKIEPLIEINVRSKGIEAVAHELDKLVSSEEELVVATERMTKVRERSETSIDRIAKKYDQEYRIAQQLAREMSILERARNAGLGGTEAFERAHIGLTKAMNDNAKAAGLARYEWVNLGRQAQDAVTMLAMGSSPMQVLTSQGAQIADVFSSSRGGAGAALKDFASTVGRGLLSPVTLAAAAFGTAAYATLQWQKQVDALTVSLNGLGRASGLTREGAMAVADRAAVASGISGSAARGLAAQYLGAGVGREALGGAIGVTRDFGRKLGMSEDDATKTLAGALADPARGAEELAKKFGLLSYAQREEIAQTAAMGDKAGATSKLVGDLREHLAKLEDPTWSLGRALDDLKSKASDFLDKIGRGVTGGEVENEFQRQARYAQAQQNLIGGKLDQGIARQLELDKLANDAAFAAREITAETYAQREAIVMEKGRMQALLDTEHATRHLMEAEGERLRMLAEAARKVEDYSKSTQREHFLSGAQTPYERGRRQILIERDELLRQIPTDVQSRRSIRVPHAWRDAPVDAFSGGTNDLVAEAARHGLEPNEKNFEELISKGIGQGKFRGRLIRMDEGLERSNIDVPRIDRNHLERQVRAAAAVRLKDYDERQSRNFFDKINGDLERQNALLNAEATSFGKSTAAIERARKEQELLNQAKQQGLPLTDEMKKKIGEEADKYGDLAKRQEEQRKEQQQIIDALDDIRDASRTVATGMLSDFQNGASGSKILENAFDRLLKKIQDIALDDALNNILGKQGSPDGGIFGGLFGAFKGSFFKGPFGLPQWPFADGGVMTGYGPIPLQRYASGGIATSPQLAMFGEGSRPEAYVPLPDGRTIPVTLQAAQQQVARAATTANRAPQMPKLVFENHAPGVEVQPVFATHDEVRYMITSTVAANNKKQAESARRSA